jgi:methionine--tRNA ligase beta chain
MPFVPAPPKPPISLALLNSVDIRVGTIEAVREVPGSKKLLALTASFGDHKRTILSAMRSERPTPEALVGRQTLFVINLEPKAMAGVVSEGMVLDLGYADGLLPALAFPERPIPDGARAG